MQKPYLRNDIALRRIIMVRDGRYRESYARMRGNNVAIRYPSTRLSLEKCIQTPDPTRNGLELG